MSAACHRHLENFVRLLHAPLSLHPKNIDRDQRLGFIVHKAPYTRIPKNGTDNQQAPQAPQPTLPNAYKNALLFPSLLCTHSEVFVQVGVGPGICAL
jgi:hypothetical protein